ncbi:MAG: hypothetical protein HKO59_00360 [Phycisphaerales bacterium]|nr:hypothetical protein [Phycisphaerales bacterium]NNM24433.1 hypothetical protein [Phycisphaerales bacterium]
MTARRLPSPLAIVATLLLGVSTLTPAADAAEVSISIESREVYVGVPFRVTISVGTAGVFESPRWPPLDGLEVLGAPSTSRQMTSVNGRTTRQEVALGYAVVARRAGRLEIPPIPVEVGGATLRTDPLLLRAVEPDGGDDLIAEVEVTRESIYLGEPVAARLKLWIRPYTDRLTNGPLNSETMWSLLDLDRSALGPFAAPIQDLIGPRRSRAVRGRTVSRPEPSTGEETTYYEYEFGVTVWPDRAGPFELEPVTLIMRYPKRLKRSRSLLSRGDLQIADARMVVEPAATDPIVVRTPPVANRPSFWSGAVGRFSVTASAKPVQVAVGDPITLSLTIVDRSSVGSPLEVLAPPPLDAVESLTGDFRVSGDPPAGVVNGSTKTFTDTLRAKRADVAEIPPIPFAYFDPQRETYVVVETTPIPISVSSANVVAAEDLIGGEPPGDPARTELTLLSGGLLANEADAARVLAGGPLRLTPAIAVVAFGIPPLAFTAVAFAERRRRRLRDDTGFARSRNATRTARRRIADARRVADGEAAALAATAVSGYVGDRCNAPPGALTTADVVAHLERRGIEPDLVREVEACLVACERIRYAGDGPAAAASLVDRAAACVQRLEATRWR